ncbi:MAG: N-acetylneuraminate synthase family protein [Deltaproteobacteria bacterium]|nr:N-acetylneuraminate synthase family protein [Deltaproteobacteria bacterium]
MLRDIFNELFVLELANNHWGSLDRGLRIINDYAKIVRVNGVKAAIKLQFRDVNSFIHKKHRKHDEIRYIWKTTVTEMPWNQLRHLVDTIKKSGCLTMATPFDEKSVDKCIEFGVEIIKVASSDLNDWPLLEKIAAAKKPTIVSTGGSSLKELDDLVRFFSSRNIPMAINHCVSLYPSEDGELELNQIDFLRNRYPDHVIGFSTHEYHDWTSSMLISYAKGARTFERHIDVNADDKEIAKYCSLPHQIDTWFKAFFKAKEMCGGSGSHKRVCSKKELQYLEGLVRGVYAKRDLCKGQVFEHGTIDQDVYMAIPLLKGQLSCRELISGEKILKPIKKDDPIFIDSVDSPYATEPILRSYIYDRGITVDDLTNDREDEE